ncbi:MAG TPA: NAD(+) diphosphatase [Methanospirillum sp.]|uniref:NAD(+) diphosphatase n=1 Tax=Methanospirillum sp. TaxID=45200 RepID=UPI002CF84EC7|nr:NAD(+) diphosphatase [Methanospirillum sp.]HWQ62935.1 NAD(+) diphosphatase [Methanospirillum sp.]
MDADGNILCSNHFPVIKEEFPGLEYTSDLPLNVTGPLFVGGTSDLNWWVYQIENGSSLSPGLELISLRTIAGSLPFDLLAILGRAIQLVRFDTTTAFCGRCGERNTMKEDELAKRCPACGLLTFPRLSPAIIVRITDEDRILLARSPQFLQGMYSLIAGFVEPGESLEAGVHREVFEEVGLRISDLKYYNSQPWPFPDSLMVGYVARYLSGEIRCDGVEIEDAQWFSRDSMPELPGKLSIARALIEDYLSS